MLPTLIELHNIGSYQDERADLSDLQIASLVGKNGTGKSTLIDGILMALYGEGTKGGEKELNNYQPLTGETDGSVTMEFLLKGNTYRIERSRNYAKSKSNAKLLWKNGDKWEVPPIVKGKGLRDVQAAIDELLRVDYRTFTNSSIILQKDAESFTNATDSERKEILAQILGLDIWDRVKAVNKKKIDDLQNSLRGSDIREADLQKTIDCRHHFEERREEIDRQLGMTEDKAAEVEAKVSTLTEQLASRPALESQIAGLRKQAEDAKKKISDLESRESIIKKSIAHSEQKVKEQQQILSRKAEIEDACEKEPVIAAEVKEWDEKQKAHMEIKDRLSKLQADQAAWDRHQAQEKAEAERRQAEWEKSRSADMARIRANIAQAASQKDLLQEVPCSEETGRSCKLLTHAWKMRDSIEEWEQTLIALDQQLSPHIGNITQLNAQKSPYSADLGEAQMDLDMSEYSAETHEINRQRLTRLQQLTKLQPSIAAAQVRVKEMEEQIDQGQIEIETIAREVVTVTQVIGGITSELQKTQDELNLLSPASFSLNEAKIELKKLKDMETGLNTEAGKIAANLEQITKAAAELEKIKSDTKELRDRSAVAGIIEKACNRKGGVPALVIENALPQVELKANDFLAGIAGGRFQIRFDTLTEVKSTGEMAEGCRVIVLDQGRERPFKTYSGAEGFIINFALRIGISLFLAHRAGAEIKLLVLDEGLGSLDDANQQAVIEAIKRAAEHFGRVLLITHIPQLQDAFSQRIEVSKDGAGSKVKIVA